MSLEQSKKTDHLALSKKRKAEIRDQAMQLMRSSIRRSTHEESLPTEIPSFPMSKKKAQYPDTSSPLTFSIEKQ